LTDQRLRKIEFFNLNYGTILTTENAKKATRLSSLVSTKNFYRDSVRVFILNNILGLASMHSLTIKYRGKTTSFIGSLKFVAVAVEIGLKFSVIGKIVIQF